MDDQNFTQSVLDSVTLSGISPAGIAVNNDTAYVVSERFGNLR